MNLGYLADTARRILGMEDPDRPWLVSFPRSGSHFLSLCLEVYTDGASPISNFLGLSGKSLNVFRLHAGEFPSTHDLELKLLFRNVIYLYRNPVDTLYSYLQYEGFPADEKHVRMASDHWARHTRKWMFAEGKSRRKTMVCYERLMKDFPGEFAKVLRHLGLTEDRAKMEAARQGAGKQEIKKITRVKDPKVINDSEEYRLGRGDFVARFGPLIMALMPADIGEAIARDAAETGEGAVAAL